MKFKLRRGCGVEAELVGAELSRIHEEHGKITPPLVVETARPDDAPLHPAFTWDDKVAAGEWRLHEARNLIRAVHVVDESTGEDVGCAFVRVDAVLDEDVGIESVYLPTAKVVAQPDLYQSALSDMRARLAEAQRSLADLEGAAARSGLQWRIRAVKQVGQALKQADAALAEAAE